MNVLPWVPCFQAVAFKWVRGLRQALIESDEVSCIVFWCVLRTSHLFNDLWHAVRNIETCAVCLDFTKISRSNVYATGNGCLTMVGLLLSFCRGQGLAMDQHDQLQHVTTHYNPRQKTMLWVSLSACVVCGVDEINISHIITWYQFWECVEASFGCLWFLCCKQRDEPHHATAVRRAVL